MGAGVEQRHRGARPTSCVGEPPQLADAPTKFSFKLLNLPREGIAHLIGPFPEWHPTIAVGDDPLQDGRASTPDQYGRAGALYGLRPRPHGREVHMLSLVRRFLLLPDRTHGFYPLTNEAEPS